MSEDTLPPAAPLPSASTPVFVATFALILACIVLLLFLDLFLAGIDRGESNAHAAAEYREGVALLSAGRSREASERFGSAVAIDRGDERYALALSEALIADGRTSEAEATLKALLDRAENAGGVNLAMAHVMIREGRVDDAKAYFHRAIFGHWGVDSLRRRTQARFELIDLLVHQSAESELLAELLPLEATPADSFATQRRLGHLFVRAGSPSRAATIFRELLRADPNDADAFAGMGEAALALGNFRTARADFAEAVRLSPSDSLLAGRLAVADSALALDPTARGLDASTRLARSRAFLERTMDALRSCTPTLATALVDSARALLGTSPTRSRDETRNEAMAAIASELWTSQAGRCANIATRADALALVHRRLTP